VKEAEALKVAKDKANQALAMDHGRCVASSFGGNDEMATPHAFFWMPWTHALIPGHIYSEAGRSEARITGFCEYCFDKVSSDSDEGEPSDVSDDQSEQEG
jgi:hypothetical protein